MKKIIVTGCAGYIGSVLTRILLREGFAVIGVDYLAFGGQSLVDIYNDPAFSFVNADIRNDKAVEEILITHKPYACVHLAAIVGDPACKKFEKDAESINMVASKKLFELCSSTGVSHFIFASTCSNYGKMTGTDAVTETSTLNPVSFYARTKVAMEEFMLSSSTKMNATVLRFSTVYGLSPRMRFDLTVNEFTRDLTMGKELQIFGPEFWRPYCHVNDLARSVVYVLNCEDISVVNNEVFNVGDNDENYQKQMIIREIQKVIPSAVITYVDQPDDPRDYRVNFDKIKKALGFKITKRVPDGIVEINSLLKNKILTDPYNSIYSNI
ncbi:MAG: NAD(P)-dependent oxidoreductase [Bacteroidota bacterium]